MTCTGGVFGLGFSLWLIWRNRKGASVFVFWSFGGSVVALGSSCRPRLEGFRPGMDSPGPWWEERCFLLVTNH
jgi:hypothetical protein